MEKDVKSVLRVRTGISGNQEVIINPAFMQLDASFSFLMHLSFKIFFSLQFEHTSYLF